MVQKINSERFKKHLLLSYINSKTNCKSFEEFIKLISTTEEECHKIIIDLMKEGYVVYKNNGYELDVSKLKDYEYFIFAKDFSLENILNNKNQFAIMYLPKHFLNKIKR